MAVILVVDDRRMNRELLVSLLGHVGHEILEAGDGREALEAVKRSRPALVITDILMPVMDGVELARALRGDPATRQVPIIFHTATYRVAEARALGASCGVSVIVSKPCDPQDLLNIVQRELGLGEQVVVAEQAAVWTKQHGTLAVDRLCTGYAVELGQLQRQLRHTLVEGNVYKPDVASWNVRQLEQVSIQADASLTRAQALSLRLAALIELNLELATHRDPATMLEMFCRASRDILNARIALVCTLHEGGGILEYAACGLTEEQSEAVRRTLVPTEGVVSEAMCSDAPIRRRGLNGQKDAVGLPACHPAIDNVLVVPIKSAARTYGWFYVADRLGAEEFSTDDQELADTLAAQLGLEYENLVLCDQLRRRAGLLQVDDDEGQRILDELRERETRLQDLVEHAREVFFLLEMPAGKVLYLSRGFETVWGRSRQSLDRDPQSWLDSVYSADYRAVLRELAKARRSGTFQLKYRIQTERGIRWLQARASPVIDPDGRLRRIAGTVEDITEIETRAIAAERGSRIRALRGQVDSAIARAPDEATVLSEACRIAVGGGGFRLAWMSTIEPSTGRLKAAVGRCEAPEVADAISSMLADDYSERRGLFTEAFGSDTRVVKNDLVAKPSSDSTLQFASTRGCASVLALPLRSGGRPLGELILFASEANYFDSETCEVLEDLAMDLSVALRSVSVDDQLKYFACYDAPTGLPNKALFAEHLAKSIALNASARTALILIDIDGLEHFDGPLEHHLRDRLLRQIGDRLTAAFPMHGDVARVGSSTFAVAVSPLHEATGLGPILRKRVFAVLRRPYELDGRESDVSARVGISICPDDAQDATKLLTLAQEALQAAKLSEAPYSFHSSALKHLVVEDLKLEQQLLVAVERREFDIDYQPRVDANLDRVVGLKTMLHWQGLAHGALSREKLIHALDASELIVDVGRSLVDRALSSYKKWLAQKLNPPRIAIEVLPVQLRYPDFADMILIALDRRGLDGSALELELTEAAILDDMQSGAKHLRRIADAGIAVTIADFPGPSSLRYASDLPLRALKIPRQIVERMTTDSDSMGSISTLIRLAHTFGLIVIADGVESEEHKSLLQLMDCDVLQGSFVGPSRSADQIEQLLAAPQ